MSQTMNDKLYAAKHALDALLNESLSGLEVFEAHCFLHKSENIPEGAMVAQIVTHRLVVTGMGEFEVKLGDKIIGAGFADDGVARAFGLSYIASHGFYLVHGEARTAANEMARVQSTDGMERPMYL